MEGAEENAGLTRADHDRGTSVHHVLGIVWRNRGLRRVELAFATFNSGEWATWIAMIVYAYSHGGVTASGVVAAAMLVPAGVFAPLLASLGERHPPGRALVAGYVAQAVSCAAVGLALLSAAPTPLGYLLMACASVSFATTRPAQAAFAPALAATPEELTATNVVSGWLESLSMLVAPTLAGVILAVSSP